MVRQAHPSPNASGDRHGKGGHDGRPSRWITLPWHMAACFHLVITATRRINTIHTPVCIGRKAQTTGSASETQSTKRLRVTSCSQMPGFGAREANDKHKSDHSTVCPHCIPNQSLLIGPAMPSAAKRPRTHNHARTHARLIQLLAKRRQVSRVFLASVAQRLLLCRQAQSACMPQTVGFSRVGRNGIRALTTRIPGGRQLRRGVRPPECMTGTEELEQRSVQEQGARMGTTVAPNPKKGGGGLRADK